jgi:hypothetical protein
VPRALEAAAVTADRAATAAAAAGLVLLLAVPGCSADDPPARQALPTATATAVPTDRATVPAGWQIRQGAGFRLAIPAAWQNRPEDQRAARGAALEVGVPFSGQPAPPPLLQVFVEQDKVGPLSIREPLLRGQLSHALPGATLGSSSHVKVAGAQDAVQFDVRYTTKAGTSVLGTRLAATPIRQRELVVETPGLPKYGLRYSAPAAQFDEATWRSLVGSLVVAPGGASASPSGSAGA